MHITMKIINGNDYRIQLFVNSIANYLAFYILVNI